MYDLTRRELLKAGGLGLASLMLPRWLVRAVGEAQLGDRCPKTLVLVMLGGGNDGLNTVAPLADPLYAKLRPTLAIPRRDLLALNDSVGFHPGLRKLRDLFEKGRVAVLQNVGYPHQNHSHFASMEIWQTGRTDGVIHDGWVGRTLDRCGCDGPLHSLAFGSEIPLALWGEGAGVLTLDNPGAFELARDARHKGDSDNIFHALRAVYAEPRAGEAEYVRARSMELLGQVDRVKSLTGAPPPATGYPKGALPDGLRFIANAIEADLGARVYMIGLGG
ncbi:MAG TPA: hypothetical protein VHF22_07760, partial [Planctomycetota bacterium]|nr:hypothetical protein [Planctomycetota bacterium]